MFVTIYTFNLYMHFECTITYVTICSSTTVRVNEEETHVVYTSRDDELLLITVPDKWQVLLKTYIIKYIQVYSVYV